jgi:hypothetical protein
MTIDAVNLSIKIPPNLSNWQYSDSETASIESYFIDDVQQTQFRKMMAF